MISAFTYSELPLTQFVFIVKGRAEYTTLYRLNVHYAYYAASEDLRYVLGADETVIAGT